MAGNTAMIDCHVCGLPMEAQSEMEIGGEPWLGMVCISGHLVTLREAELPGASAI